MYKEVKEINIVDIISRYIELKRVGNEHLGICPFHADDSLGSFKVNASKGIFKCFSCGESGDAINFVQNYKNIRSLDAAVEIAIEEEIISHAENDMYIINQINYKSAKISVERRYLKRNLEDILVQTNDIEILDKVYNILLEGSKLTEEHRRQLIKERGISEKIIEKRKYKSYPNKSELKDIFIILKDEFENIDDILSSVPGFFQKKTHEGWKWTIKHYGGIVIPIRNTKNYIIGLQIRSDNSKNSKYFWLSSADKTFSNDYRYGSSPGSPLDITYPEDDISNTLFITEGRFKAEMITKELGSACISVQGVGNWEGINNQILNLEEESKKRFKNFSGFTRIYIAFDMDVSYNNRVYKQLKNMVDYIGEDFCGKDIAYVSWDMKYKGIDDLILNNKKEKPNDYFKLLYIEEI